MRLCFVRRSKCDDIKHTQISARAHTHTHTEEVHLRLQPLERQLHAAKSAAESAHTAADRAHAEALEVKMRSQAQLADMMTEMSREKEATEAANRECRSMGLQVQALQQSAAEAKALAEHGALQLVEERARKEALAQEYDKKYQELEVKAHSAAVRQQQSDVQQEYAMRDKEAATATRDAAERAQRSSEERLNADLAALRRELVLATGACQRAEAESAVASRELVSAQETASKWQGMCEEERVSAARAREELEARLRCGETEVARLQSQVSRSVHLLELKKSEVETLQDKLQQAVDEAGREKKAAAEREHLLRRETLDTENDYAAVLHTLKSEKAQLEFQEQAAKASLAHVMDELKSHRQVAAQEHIDARTLYETEREAMGQRIRQVCVCVCVCVSVCGVRVCGVWCVWCVCV